MVLGTEVSYWEWAWHWGQRSVTGSRRSTGDRGQLLGVGTGDRGQLLGVGVALGTEVSYWE